MREARFVNLNKEKWSRMERMDHLDADTLAENYVALTDDLSYARTFFPGSDAERYLNGLVAAYQINIYGQDRRERRTLLGFWMREFPALLWERRRTLLFAVVFFVFSVAVGAFSASRDTDFTRLILGDSYVDMTLDNIEKGTPMGVYAQGGAMEMFWAITINNVKVAFVAFALGLLFSAGSLWVLFSNGVMLGAFQYFFYEHGALFHSMLSVWAHGTFEITSIVIAGGAGLVMGNGLLFPGTYRRGAAFRRGAMDGVKIVAGLVPFFIIAGWIEGFVTRYADAMPVVGAATIVLSLAGVFVTKREKVVPVALEQFLKDHPNIRCLHLHLDNDLVGRGAVKGIMEGLQDQYEIRDEPPARGKDVNEMLMLRVGLMKEKEALQR